MSRLLGLGRYVLLVAVIGSFIGSVTVLIFGAVSTVRMAIEAFAGGRFNDEGARLLAVDFIGMIDLFLLGAVLYIVALGLYELFISDKTGAPEWLVITSLEDLKERLLRVIVVMISVAFLGYVVTWDKSARILELGIAIGVVLGALAFLVGRPKQ